MSAALAWPSAAIGRLCSSRMPPGQRQALAEQLAPQVVPEQHDRLRTRALHRDADRRARRAAVERLRRAPARPAPVGRAAGRSAGRAAVWEQLPRVGGIVDLARGRRQVGRFAGHHQQVHAHHDSRSGPRATIQSVMQRWLGCSGLLTFAAGCRARQLRSRSVQEYAVPAGSHPHDVAPAVDGGVWFTAQAAGYLGWLDPTTGEMRQIALGPRSAPHGVIVGPDGAPWVTDGGQNAIVRVDPQTSEVRLFPLPGRNANLNTAAFDRNGILWFTGQNGVYGRVDPTTGEMKVFDAPRGAGPYGITATPDGARVFYASLAGSHIAEINLETGQATPIDPPTPRQGARRVWTDSHGVIWVSEWNAGQVGRYDPRIGRVAGVEAARALGRARTRSTSTSRTRSGSATGAATRSSASIRRPRRSSSS